MRPIVIFSCSTKHFLIFKGKKAPPPPPSSPSLIRQTQAEIFVFPKVKETSLVSELINECMLLCGLRFGTYTYKRNVNLSLESDSFGQCLCFNSLIGYFNSECTILVDQLNSYTTWDRPQHRDFHAQPTPGE